MIEKLISIWPTIALLLFPGCVFIVSLHRVYSQGSSGAVRNSLWYFWLTLSVGLNMLSTVWLASAMSSYMSKGALPSEVAAAATGFGPALALSIIAGLYLKHLTKFPMALVTGSLNVVKTLGKKRGSP